MEDYYVDVYNYENPETVFTYLVHSLNEANDIVNDAWDRGPAWDAFIRPATDLSTSDEGA